MFVVAFLIGVGAAGWVVAEGVAAGCCLSAGSLAWVVLRVGVGYSLKCILVCKSFDNM